MRSLIPALALCALLACACARTATRAPPISAHITSLSDKDARTKATTHPAFTNAGTRAGLEVWRIENFDPVPIPASDHGKFYKGDSYVVLKTSADKRGTLSWDIHYWIGSESSQDESGAAAILTVGLDDKFNGAAIQHRETMAYESSQFTGYFQPAIRYLDGGHASGFHHVTTNAGAEKRLFQIKGKRNVRVRQVDPVISSMNKGDVFILDKDHDVYVYVGPKAKNVERLKAISVANQIRDQDHNGRARVEIIDQYSSEVDVQKFFTALGSGSKDLVPEESAGGDDQQFERSEEQSVTLSEVSDASGKIKITPLAKPIKQEQLKPQEVYILDTVSGSIYIWVGKQATEKEKIEAMAKAQDYLQSKKYPSWVHVMRIPQGTEPAVFKQYFSTWRDVGMAHSRIVREAPYNDVEQDSFQRGTVMNSDGYPRLYEAVITNQGRISFERQPQITQRGLSAEGVYVLDSAPDTCSVWLGKLAPDHAAKSLLYIAEAYHTLHRQTTDALRVDFVKQGAEGDAFVNSFPVWDPDMWVKRNTDEDETSRFSQENEIASE